MGSRDSIRPKSNKKDERIINGAESNRYSNRIQNS